MLFWKNKSGHGESGRGAGASKINTRRDQRMESKAPLPKAVWIPLAGLLAVALGAFLTWKIAALLFWDNPDYTIKKMEIHVDGPTITANHVREYLGVSEGTNLFATCLHTMRTTFLKKTPIAKSVILQRRLPDTLVVDIVERVPLARLGRWGSLAVDREGYVFSLRAGSREYPVISGCSAENLKPGARVDQSVMNAIEIIDVCARTKVGEHVKIASLDVSSKQSLEFYLSAGERIKIAWQDMEHSGPDVRKRIEQKLWGLAAALRNSEERGRRLVNLDLSFTDQYVPGQEY
ncbi:MAG: FtsQ-type POTRA domain-containing protein [bacterium]